MRRSILSIILVAALGGCGGSKEDAQDVRQVDQQLAGDNLIDNDLTAIDAVTGADANMAADVDPSAFEKSTDESGNATTARRSTTQSAQPPENSSSEDEPADSAEPTSPAANTSESN